MPNQEYNLNQNLNFEGEDDTVTHTVDEVSEQEKEIIRERYKKKYGKYPEED